jgi:hypothetical protein
MEREREREEDKCDATRAAREAFVAVGELATCWRLVGVGDPALTSPLLDPSKNCPRTVQEVHCPNKQLSAACKQASTPPAPEPHSHSHAHLHLSRIHLPPVLMNTRSNKRRSELIS